MERDRDPAGRLTRIEIEFAVLGALAAAAALVALWNWL